MNLFIPMAALPGLSVPPLAITDGSADATWVDVSCAGGYVYGRRRTLRLPFDAGTAGVVHRRIRLDRRVRTVWTPISLTAFLAALVILLVADDDDAHIVFLLAGLGVSLWTDHLQRKVAVAQLPEIVGRLGVYLPWVSAAVAAEWVARNPAVLVVPGRPRWRRFSSRAYRWAAGVCAVAAVGVWWAGLSDGEFDVRIVLVFLVLIGAAVGLAVKALPAGFVRWDGSR